MTVDARPRLLDLFCGAGGAAKGYQLAGFYVVGVDIKPQPRCCADEFIQDDAMGVLDWMVSGDPDWWSGFDAIHASPPCQAYSWSAKRWRNVKRADLIDPVREKLERIGLPYVIENVIGAPLRQQLVLCGRMFNLPLIRHRLFESNQALLAPVHPKHAGSVRGGDFVTVAGHGGDGRPGTERTNPALLYGIHRAAVTCGAGGWPMTADARASQPHPDWVKDCMEFRGRVLYGKFGHFCLDWDGLPIDETCEEWPCGCPVSEPGFKWPSEKSDV